MLPNNQQTPVYHIDAYIFAKYGQEIMPFLSNDDVKRSLNKYFGHTISDDDLTTYLSVAPKDKTHEVKALATLGIPQIRIAEMLGISQGMVSRYMKKTANFHFYPNTFIHRVRNWYNYDRKQEWKYFHDMYCTDMTGIKFNSI